MAESVPEHQYVYRSFAKICCGFYLCCLCNAVALSYPILVHKSLLGVTALSRRNTPGLMVYLLQNVPYPVSAKYRLSIP